REWASVALGGIGPGAKAAVPALLAIVKDKSNLSQVRYAAGVALGKIGPEARAAVPDLLEVLTDPKSDATLRALAVYALGGIGPAAKAAVPTLTALARDRSARSWDREAPAKALVKIDPEFAAREGLEYAYLNVQLGNVPAIKLGPRAPLAEEKKQRIKRLI